ncbi:hypothetical protein F5Y15DRAFT_333031 [Xylariaceae sp. FL0016]|nr:hypothetical protein F5Y15DRAFT_333031 [Xylariaceae sp. FL0016]
MSATMTMTAPPSSIKMPSTTTITTSSCCPNCGLSLPSSDSHAALLSAQKQIEDLQAQVRLLNQKATAAVDRWADYEDELSKLRSAAAAANNNKTTPNPPPDNRPVTPTPSQPESQPSPSPYRTSFLPTGAASRISQLLSPRKSTPNLVPAGPSLASSSQHHRSRSALSSTASTDDLLEALSREKSLRAAAEGKLADSSQEIEELSVTLFEQANEMVATERRARARLEERVSVLERRDGEKRDRLDKLEGAMGRIERVKKLLEDA